MPWNSRAWTCLTDSGGYFLFVEGPRNQCSRSGRGRVVSALFVRPGRLGGLLRRRTFGESDAVLVVDETGDLTRPDDLRKGGRGVGRAAPMHRQGRAA